MEKKFILVSMEDTKAKKIAEVLGNKTCKKIIDALTENKNLSEKELAHNLGIPINTVEYNLKKLLEAGLIDKAKNYFWSKKGKKIILYTLSNKSIIIQPKNTRVSSKIKSILSVLGISAVFAIILKYFSESIYASRAPERILEASTDEAGVFAEKSAQAANVFSQNIDFFFTQSHPTWIWFLSGALLAIIIFTILNWRKL